MDSVMQNIDVGILFNRPFMMGITKYGPSKYLLGPDDIVGHIIKNRVDEQALLFFKQNLKSFTIEESEIPATAK